MKSKVTKPNCYDCKHRGNIAGDAHSCCKHPDAGMGNDPLTMLLAILGKRLDHSITSEGSKKLGIVGNPHGIKMGWFIWPLNYDPIWLEKCNGFEKA